MGRQLFAVLALLLTSFVAYAQNALQVTFIDVGQGDSTLIVTPDHQVILIDGGESDSRVLEYLEDHGIDRIDVVIATHPHSDHIAGLIPVLNALPVERVITNGQAATTSVSAEFANAIDSAHASCSTTRQGDRILLDSIAMDVLSPEAIDGDPNHDAIVLSLAYQGCTFLFMSDADIDAENEILDRYPGLHATIVRIGHHGDASSSGLVFLTTIDPSIAVISVGSGNPYGHPSERTLNILRRIGCTVFTTMENGDISVLIDETSIRIFLDGVESSSRSILDATTTPIRSIPGRKEAPF